MLPALELILFLIAIGAPPVHLAFVVVNHDSGFVSVGDMYVSDLANSSDTLHLIYKDTVEQGNDLVREGLGTFSSAQ